MKIEGKIFHHPAQKLELQGKVKHEYKYMKNFNFPEKKIVVKKNTS